MNIKSNKFDYFQAEVLLAHWVNGVGINYLNSMSATLFSLVWS